MEIALSPSMIRTSPGQELRLFLGISCATSCGHRSFLESFSRLPTVDPKSLPSLVSCPCLPFLRLEVPLSPPVECLGQNFSPPAYKLNRYVNIAPHTNALRLFHQNVISLVFNRKRIRLSLEIIYISEVRLECVFLLISLLVFHSKLISN